MQSLRIRSSFFKLSVIFAQNCARPMKKRSVTIHDIARELNTTASTVSRALQDHPRISKNMKEAVWELSQKLNYQPNSIASSLRRGRGSTIGVIVPRIDRHFFSSVIRGIEDVAYEANYNVLICQSYDSYEREKAIVDTLTNGKVDGLLVSLAFDSSDYTHFLNVQSKNIPLIFFDRVPDLPKFSQIESNDFKGALMAVEHLISVGCKRITYFSGPLHVSIYRKRFEGYKAALEKHNIAFDENLVFDRVITRESGERAALEMSKFKNLPDGLFSAGDFSAYGAIMTFKKLGIRIPQDIAVVGFANEPFDEMLDPPLSSVEQHSLEMGQRAARLIFEKISDPLVSSMPNSIILDAELLIRCSSMK